MHIDYDMAVAELNKAANSKPEGYAYTTDPKTIATYRADSGEDWISMNDDGVEMVTSCRYYQTDGSPGCIIGTVFYNLDPEFVLEEGRWRTDKMPEGWTIDPKAARLFSRAQTLQDTGNIWKEAVTLAIAQVDAEYND